MTTFQHTVGASKQTPNNLKDVTTAKLAPLNRYGMIKTLTF